MPAKAGIQYAVTYREDTEYWPPAFAGVTSGDWVAFCASHSGIANNVSICRLSRITVFSANRPSSPSNTMRSW